MIRAMARRDLPEAARLATQLGYPTSEAEIADRCEYLARSADDYVYVAEVDGHRVAGRSHLPGPPGPGSARSRFCSEWAL